MSERIESIAVLGAGTMGSGIAAACAAAGYQVLLLDVTKEQAERSIRAMTEGRAPALEDATAAARIKPGDLASDLGEIGDYDWICEAIVEDLETKRDLFSRIEPFRRDSAVISTNTSGIPLRAITKDMPKNFNERIVVTHFFNPVKVMKLLEIVPGDTTDNAVVERLADFGREQLGKGVVYAKDTVNFIGNRIGCFWMLSGLHKAKAALANGLSMEEIDALMGEPVGIPRTGLYGLIDLIGLDIMDLVGKNLATNLPEGDVGHAFTALPSLEKSMLERGQLGRKTGGGFYRMLKAEDGSRSKETFDLLNESWRPAQKVELGAPHNDASSLLFADDDRGHFATDLMGGTLLYAADLVPEIANDIVNIDRAMRWGFNWRKGPFELLDEIGPSLVIADLERQGRPIPKMLKTLQSSDHDQFYNAEAGAFLGQDGNYHPVPKE
ncbi:MAG: 3-hydroxyacyl-CoA dehydrogenase NAD-binding domain-containing protein [Geminicoccales bacterium]